MNIAKYFDSDISLGLVFGQLQLLGLIAEK